ncbi:EscF/YscF/HrpA family type III secretion system needle major subunit [Acanthopleuribacter pedis]|uniref:EscF/YscF/HrpA family type III secretion system needle major subunit n=1 Tax=Acanthopleuribacter pedis TaxID=442870 RepID=A0A8J7QF92_9BACT|nr:EscF/YscF/HrpA family type III secretion system needle major subunit [Acanthopleuribacter pedis]MBO1322984.1 hypothetical protein [Acanthopleuribacter pedis]
MSGLTLGNVNSALGEAVTTVENDLQQQIDGFDAANADSADLISLQLAMSKWSLATQLQSNTIKTVSEGLKTAVGNIR